MLAALQTFYGLWPLRRVRREVAAIRSRQPRPASPRISRAKSDPLIEEINELLAHSEEQAEEARRHAGNLAHALKTPLTVITNAATAAVARPRRHGDPRSGGRCAARSTTISPAPARSAAAPRPRRAPPCGKASRRSSARSTALRGGHRRHRRRPAGAGPGRAAGPRRNARQSGRECRQIWRRPGVRHGRAASGGMVDILVEDDGPGIPEAERETLFARGARLDTTASPAPALASPSSATSPKSTAADRARGKRGSRRPAGAPDAPRRLSRQPRRSSKIACAPMPCAWRAVEPIRSGGVVMSIEDNCLLLAAARSRCARDSPRCPRRPAGVRHLGLSTSRRWTGRSSPATISSTYVNGAWAKRTADRRRPHLRRASIPSLNDQIDRDVRAIVEDMAKNPASVGPDRPAGRRFLRHLDG